MRKLNMLVIDDDPGIVRLISTIIEKSEFNELLSCTGLTDSFEAIEWLENNCCDLVLTDFEMPKFNGMDVLRKARERNVWTQVVFLTGHSTLDRLTVALENGATDYLMKPLNREDFLDVLGQLVQRMQRWKRSAHSTLAKNKVNTAE